MNASHKQAIEFIFDTDKTLVNSGATLFAKDQFKRLDPNVFSAMSIAPTWGGAFKNAIWQAIVTNPKLTTLKARDDLQKDEVTITEEKVAATYVPLD